MTQPQPPENQQPQDAASSPEQQYQQGFQTSAPSAYSAPGAAPYGQQAPGQYAQQGYPQQGHPQQGHPQGYPPQGGGAEGPPADPNQAKIAKLRELVEMGVLTQEEFEAKVAAITG